MPPLASCAECGTELEAGADSCLECGTPVGLQAVPASFDPSTESPTDTPGGDPPPTRPTDPEDEELSATVLMSGVEPPADPFTTAPTAAPAPDLLAALQQATMGRYLIETELGRGGMAAVFLAHERLANRKVAIKVMSPALFHGVDTVERFRLEAMTTASLSHPGIVPIYLVEESGGLLFFVMKYVAGPTLETHIAETGPLPFEAVETVIKGAGEALDYAHSEGVIHRDIKPGNLMLDRAGRPVITDFGIAKVAAQETLTLTGKTIGTPTYMSPEQCRGGSITGASDQYSFGVVLYEMLAGRVPFKADSHWALLYKHLNDPPPHIGEARPDCPQRLWDIVDRMLAKNAEDRWSSFEEAISYLTTAPRSQVGVPVAVPPPPEGAPPPMAVETAEGVEDAARVETGEETVPAEVVEPASRPSRLSRRTVAMAGAVAVAVPLLFLAGRPMWQAVFAPGPGTDAVEAIVPNPTDAAVGVLAGLTISPTEPRLEVGQEISLVSLATDAAGAPIGDAQISFESSDPSVATVTGAGLVRAGAPGSTTITASAGDQVATALISVAAAGEAGPDRVATLWISEDSVALEAGLAQTVRAEPRDAAGQPLSGRTVDWQSANPSVARVTPDGENATILGGAVGTTRVFARVDGVERSLAVVVAPEPVSAIDLDLSDLTLVEGESSTIGAIVRGVRTPVIGGAPAWRSSDPGVASVDARGVVVGNSAGEALITASAGGRTATLAVTVESAAPVAAAPSVTGLGATLELLDGGGGLGHTLTLAPVNPGAAQWCAVTVVSHGDDGESFTRITQDFDPQAGGAQSVALSTPFDQLDLDPSQYRATARLVSSQIGIWGMSCSAVPTDGVPLGSAEASICLSKLGSGGWRDRPSDCR